MNICNRRRSATFVRSATRALTLTKFTTKMPHPRMSQLRTQTIHTTLYKDISLQQPRTPFWGKCTSIVPKLLGKGTHARAHAKKPPTCGTVRHRILSRCCCCCCCCAAGQFALPFARPQNRAPRNGCEWVHMGSCAGVHICKIRPRNWDRACGATRDLRCFCVLSIWIYLCQNVRDDDVHMYTCVLYYDMPNVKI